MATTTKLMTAEELFALPDDGFHKHELVRGELVTMVPPGLGHGNTASAFVQALGPFVRERNLGRIFIESGVVLERRPDTVRGPDVSFISADRLPPPEQRAKFFEGAPDLAIEVVSPGDTATELLEKVHEYLAAGCRLVWVADPKTRTVTAYRPDGSAHVYRDADTLSGEDVLPGLSVPVRQLFW
jgi:Uma2 family endonuclease